MKSTCSAATLLLTTLVCSTSLYAGESQFVGYNWKHGSAEILERGNGKIVVLCFLATYMPPFQVANEIPKLVSACKGKPVRVVGMFSETRSEHYGEVLERFKVTFPTCIDLANRGSKRLSVKTLPYFVVIDKDGAVLATGLSSTTDVKKVVVWALGDRSDRQSEGAKLVESKRPEPVGIPILDQYKTLMAFEGLTTSRRSDHDIALRISDIYPKMPPALQKTVLKAMAPAIHSELLTAARRTGQFALIARLPDSVSASGGTVQTGLKKGSGFRRGKDYRIAVIGGEHAAAISVKAVPAPGATAVRQARVRLVGTIGKKTHNQSVEGKPVRFIEFNLKSAEYQIRDVVKSGGLDIHQDCRVYSWTTIGSKKIPN